MEKKDNASSAATASSFMQTDPKHKLVQTDIANQAASSTAQATAQATAQSGHTQSSHTESHTERHATAKFAQTEGVDLHAFETGPQWMLCRFVNQFEGDAPEKQRMIQDYDSRSCVRSLYRGENDSGL